jgi:hypothetical protein
MVVANVPQQRRRRLLPTLADVAFVGSCFFIFFVENYTKIEIRIFTIRNITFSILLMSFLFQSIS